MDPDQPAPRRRGLPRTTEEQQAQADPAHNTAETTPQTPDETSAESPARRTGLNAPPTRRTGMGQAPVPEQETEQQPARRHRMGEQPAASAGEPIAAEPSAGSPSTRSRRAGLAGQAPSSTPAQQRPQPAPAQAQTSPAAKPAPKAPKSQPSQKTFLNRTGKQWAVQSGIGVAAVLVLAAVTVLVTRWMLGTEAVAGFVERYPGQYPQPQAPGGYPWWLNWAHFFNAFLMVLVIKTGIQIRTEARPAAYWSPKWNKKRKISLTIWLHNSLDLLWVLNGAVFVLLLIITGYWQRVVPTSWEVFPNALSAGLQYASLDWPTAGEWAHYNSLQELAYFTTIFIAAPVAILTGVRMSGLWPANNERLNKLFPVELARAVHFPVMIYFTVFILIHLILVFATDALANLNQIYTGDETQNWTGFWLFALSLLIIIGGAFLARALFVAPIASLFGRVGR